jgi:hypothetical protein
MSQMDFNILLGNRAITRGIIMYKIEIDISGWEFNSETVTIETNDFEKIAIIQEFIEFQENHGWCVDYDVTDEYVYNQSDEVESDEAEESEESEIGEQVEDENGLVWERVA